MMGNKTDLTIPDGYKQTDVGIIPEDWDVKSLGELTEKVGSGITPTGGEKVYKSEGRPFIRSQNVGWGNLLMDDIAFIDDEIHSTFKATEIKESDVFLNITGASIGRSALADNRVVRGNVNQHVCIIRTIKQELHPNFLNAYLLSRKGQKQIDSFQAGGNRQGLNFGQIKSFQVPLPPLPEQQAIAEVLSDMDALVSSLDQLITKKRNIKQGTMQLLLTGKKRLAGFSDDWETKTLGEVALFINGRAYHISEWENSGVPVIRLQNLTGGDEYYYSNLNIPQKQYCNYGDLLFMWSATFGVHIWKGQKAIYHYHIWKIECKPSLIEKDFLYFKLGELTQELKQTSTNGGTMLHVTKEIMEATKILLPPTIEEQKAIAQILCDMDAEIETLEMKREKYKAIKQGMMQELLTGKTRLI